MRTTELNPDDDPSTLVLICGGSPFINVKTDCQVPDESATSLSLTSRKRCLPRNEMNLLPRRFGKRTFVLEHRISSLGLWLEGKGVLGFGSFALVFFSFVFLLGTYNRLE